MALLHLLAIAAIAQPAPRDWPQWGRNPQQQAFNPVPPARRALREWTFTARDRVVSSPAVAFGRVYAGSDDGHLYAVDAASGRLVWKFAAPIDDPTCRSSCDPETDPACDPDPERPDDKGFQCEHGLCLCPKIRSDPAVDSDGNVYFGAYNRQLYKVSPQGQLVWNVTTGGAIYGPPTIDADGTVYIGSFDQYVYAISPAGSVKWRAFIGAHGDSGIAIGDGAQSHVLMTQSNEGGNCTAWPPEWGGVSGGQCFIFALDKRSGKELWRRHTGKPGGGGAVTNGAYISGNWNNYVTSYDMLTGKLNWQLDVKGEVESRPAIVDGVAFITTEESKLLLAIDATSGKIKWSYAGAAEELNGSPAVSRDLVFAGSNDRYLHAVDRQTGELRFKFETCANVFSSAAIADSGMVYVGCNSPCGPVTGVGVGELYAINPSLHTNASTSR